MTAVCVLCAAFAAACASAGDRYNEGLELEAEGRWREAALRYVDALEREDTLREARTRLRVAADSAVIYGLRDADARRRAGAMEAAADVFLELDGMLARVAAVDFAPAPTGGYAQARRAALDGAIGHLMSEAAGAERSGAWSSAQGAYRRIRSRYLPDTGQARDAWEAEARLLVSWADAEMEAERYRAAFLRADEALRLEWAPSRATADAATRILERSASLGTRVLAALPVSARAAVGGMSGEATARQLSDQLELEYWRAPPPLVAVVDPARLRQIVRRAETVERPLTDRGVREVLDDVGADFGALLEIAELTLTERVDRTTTEQTRTRDGRQRSYQFERGRLTFQARVEVLIVDARGTRLAEFTRNASESGSFERARYDGDPAELDLSRNEARRFDADVQRAVQQEVLNALIEELAEYLGPAVYERVVSRIP